MRPNVQVEAEQTQEPSQDQVISMHTSGSVSVDDTSDESESDATESENHISSPSPETIVNQQQESGSTTEQIVTQIPESSNDAQEYAQPSQVSGFTNDDREQAWDSFDLGGGCDRIEDHITSWAESRDFEYLFSEESADVEGVNGPTEVVKLPSSGQQVLPHRFHPRRTHAMDKKLHKVMQAGKVDSRPQYKQGNAGGLRRPMQTRRMVRNCLLAIIKGIDKCNANDAVGTYSRTDAPSNVFT